ncbi:hypothetical protein K474DRAFT_1759025 [Panus rudis PR-1116 ss-1]|nr:hypothetical protein K474DRAFT_1759025 [Panus rudis PR-1116 ss-1]
MPAGFTENQTENSQRARSLSNRSVGSQRPASARSNRPLPSPPPQAILGQPQIQSGPRRDTGIWRPEDRDAIRAQHQEFVERRRLLREQVDWLDQQSAELQRRLDADSIGVPVSPANPPYPLYPHQPLPMPPYGMTYGHYAPPWNPWVYHNPYSAPPPPTNQHPVLHYPNQWMGYGHAAFVPQTTSSPIPQTIEHPGQHLVTVPAGIATPPAAHVEDWCQEAQPPFEPPVRHASSIDRSMEEMYTTPSPQAALKSESSVTPSAALPPQTLHASPIPLAKAEPYGTPTAGLRWSDHHNSPREPKFSPSLQHHLRPVATTETETKPPVVRSDRSTPRMHRSSPLRDRDTPPHLDRHITSRNSSGPPPPPPPIRHPPDGDNEPSDSSDSDRDESGRRAGGQGRSRSPDSNNERVEGEPQLHRHRTPRYDTPEDVQEERTAKGKALANQFAISCKRMIKEYVRDTLSHEQPLEPAAERALKNMRLPSPEKYNGADDWEVYKAWVQQLCNHFQTYGMGGSKYEWLRVASIGAYLKGRANRWYYQCVSRMHTAKEQWTTAALFCAMYDRFIHSATSMNALVAFEEVEYDSTAGVSAFYSTLMDAAEELTCPPSKGELVKKFARGLPAYMLKKMIELYDIDVEASPMKEVLAAVTGIYFPLILIIIFICSHAIFLS